QRGHPQKPHATARREPILSRPLGEPLSATTPTRRLGNNPNRQSLQPSILNRRDLAEHQSRRATRRRQRRPPHLPLPQTKNHQHRRNPHGRPTTDPNNPPLRPVGPRRQPRQQRQPNNTRLHPRPLQQHPTPTSTDHRQHSPRQPGMDRRHTRTPHDNCPDRLG